MMEFILMFSGVIGILAFMVLVLTIIKEHLDV
jgi:hypothetical protein